jgi:tripartite-type tricarboxylate transporter receptor subunit TctC
MLRLMIAGAMIAAATSLAWADDDFFKGKTITIINSTGTGGSYHNIAQALTRHMPRYIPGQPSMIVKSMPGGGNVLATNFMYNRAPTDGTHIATINNSIPLHQVLDGSGVHYDASKFNWLGSTGSYNSVAYVWHTAGVRTFKDLLEKEVILGGTGAGSSIVIYPTATNSLLGTKFKIVLGYKSTAEIDVAMERGEVQARTGSYTALLSEHPDWVKDKRVIILFQIGNKRDPALADVPLLTELAASEEQREILKLISSPIALGRPYLAPPNIPADRLAVLRKAFAATLRDKEFVAEMTKLSHDIDPMTAEDVEQIIQDTVNAPAPIIAKAKALMGSGDKAP